MTETKPQISVVNQTKMIEVSEERVLLNLSRAEAELLFTLAADLPIVIATDQGVNITGLCNSLQDAGLNHKPFFVRIERAGWTER